MDQIVTDTRKNARGKTNLQFAFEIEAVKRNEFTRITCPGGVLGKRRVIDDDDVRSSTAGDRVLFTGSDGVRYQVDIVTCPRNETALAINITK